MLFFRRMRWLSLVPLIGSEILRGRIMRCRIAPVPLTKDDARALLDQLKGRKLLDGVRGEPAADVDALARLLVDLGRFAADFADEVQEVDLNPVLVHPEGDGVTVVDALIVKQGE